MRVVRAMSQFLFIILLLPGFALSAENQEQRVQNIVLVYGAWADGSGWKGVYDILVKDGYNVSIVLAGSPPAPEGSFVASTEKTFDQLMEEAMNVMHRDMHNAEYSGEADHDFVTMMIPHHQDAIDMAKALLLYGKDPQVRRLAQEIITDQQSEIQLMKLWLKRNNASSQTPTLKRD